MRAFEPTISQQITSGSHNVQVGVIHGDLRIAQGRHGRCLDELADRVPPGVWQKLQALMEELAIPPAAMLRAIDCGAIRWDADGRLTTPGAARWANISFFLTLLAGLFFVLVCVSKLLSSFSVANGFSMLAAAVTMLVALHLWEWLLSGHLTGDRVAGHLVHELRKSDPPSRIGV